MKYLQQNDRLTGTHYEEIACRYLLDSGIEILERNYRIRIGEIDIIAKDKDCICFIEVKFRHSLKYGRPAEAVTAKKQTTIRKVAGYWMLVNRSYDRNVRFDIIEIIGTQINYLKYAF